MMRPLAENANFLIVLAGFSALEVGIAQQWSVPVAAMIGGGVVMALGVWPYVRLPRRK